MIEIIAEIGQNFNGDVSLAKELIRLAKINGADVAKFQVYDAKSLFSKNNNEWYDYNCKTELTKEHLEILKDECDNVGVEFMASVFDEERVEWLESLGIKRFKIASRSVHDVSLTNKILSTNKPIVVSLGMWNRDEFPEIKSSSKVDFLYCISKYPTNLECLNFDNVDFKEKYSGFSDHTLGIVAPIVAMSRGAKIIEKHFTLDKNMYGPDHSCSMNPSELNELVIYKERILQCL
jgi:sialic acid synthase SpsE